MPELPEVETVVRGLRPRLEGRVLAQVDVRRRDLRIPFPPGFADALRGRRVLRPGGTIWVATPNLDASGRRVFGEDYVQLDAPRHLVLFTRSALRALLARAGFTDVHEPPVVPHARAWTFPRSAAIRAGLGSHPDPLPPLPLRLRLRAALADLRALVTTSRTEELVLIARKPGV